MQTSQLAKNTCNLKALATLALTFIGLSQQVLAQPFTVINDGAMFYVNDDAKMIINGNYINQDSIFINRGHTIVTGDFTIGAGSVVGGTGIPYPKNNDTIEVHGDWWNNGTFNSGDGNSLVYLNGPGDQVIRGSQETHFHQLSIDNGGIKYQDTNAYVSHKLWLNDQELATDKFTMFVTNPDPTSVDRDTFGFVSSLEEGALSRVTAGVDVYVFPVGSSLFNQYTYRPAVIRPVNADTNVYTVRMVYADPSPSPPNGPGYDVNLHEDSICYVNSDYWYKIKRTSGNSAAALSLTYRWDFEGAFNGIARWDLNQSPQQWYSLGGPFDNNPYATTPYNLTSVFKEGWVDFDPNNHAYSLVYRKPYAPEFDGPLELCANEPTLYTGIVGTNDADFVTPTFSWDITNGTIVSATPDSQQVTILWNDVDSGYITLTEIGGGFYSFSGSCPSYTETVAVDIWPLPDAIFGVDYQYNNGLGINPDGLLFTHELITYIDSSTNTESWYWEFGDNTSSTYQNPYHTYSEIGTYTTMLVATSPDGCLDTAYLDQTVSEGLIIPNVFTPDGDGYNDVFTLRNSNVVNFKLEIYNRWGNLIYSTTAPQVAWDGKTTAGIEAPAGTYFWTVEAALGSGSEFSTNAQDHPFQNTGWVQLIR